MDIGQNRLACCLDEGVGIFDKTTGAKLSLIHKPKESSKWAILIQKIPGLDKSKYALWRDGNTLSMIDFEKSMMRPFAFPKYDTSPFNKQQVVINDEEKELRFTVIEYEWREGVEPSKTTIIKLQK